ENLLATAAAAEALGLPHEAVREGFTRRGTIPGRLEPVDRGQPFPVYIDYAHTPGALEAVLRSVAEVTGRRIIVIFGAGGDRDRAKRAPMGRVAGELAELPILSSDNPRTEDPLAIIQMVEEGVKQAGNPGYRVVPDRREAIRRAIQVAGPEHAVVITGKGHEEVQEIGGQKLPFSDRAEVEKALEERFGAPAHG
ncbi:MAG TPA: cyanophycin synthetase, partial [Thermoanaerobaculia bacterium]|nr:cyanophycin synthetase [Thermoanaerobaculia bacterium]